VLTKAEVLEIQKYVKKGGPDSIEMETIGTWEDEILSLCSDWLKLQRLRKKDAERIKIITETVEKIVKELRFNLEGFNRSNP